MFLNPLYFSPKHYKGNSRKGKCALNLMLLYYNVIIIYLNLRCSTDLQKKELLKCHMLLAGGVGGLMQAVLGCPIEVVKIRIQTLGFVGRSYDCMKYIYRHEGLYGLFRGLVPMIWRDVLPYGIYMLVYDWMYDIGNKIPYVRAIRTQSNYESNIWAIQIESALTSLAAFAASILSWTLITPLDVVKTIMQAEINPNIHKNMFQCAAMLWKAHNYRALFSGSFMIIGKSYATLVGYQYSLDKCQNRVQQQKS